MIDALKAAKGADFDALFIDQQTTAHMKTLDALTAYSAGGESEPLRAFATKALPVVQGHIDKLAAMKK